MRAAAIFGCYPKAMLPGTLVAKGWQAAYRGRYIQKIIMFYKIKYWWQGRYISAAERDGGTNMLLVGIYKRHWTSNTIHQLIKFWVINWKILLPIFVTTIVTLFIYFDSKATKESDQKKQHEINTTMNINKSPNIK